MRGLVLCVLGALLPCALPSASLYSISPLGHSGGDVMVPSGGQGSSLLNPSETPTVPGNSGYSGYSGYSGGYGGYPLSAIHPVRGLRPNALDTVGMAKPRSLRHRFAVGVDSIPAASLAGSSNAAVAVPSALSVRWWATERAAVDLLLGGNYNSAEPGKGALTPLVSSNPGSAVYAGGLGLRYNVAELSHDLLSQIVVKASGAQATGSISGWTGKATQTTLAAFVGAGFEAFIPGWDWISIEGSAGVTGFSQYLTPQGGGEQTVSGVGLAGSGFSPFNLAAHVYF